MQFGRGQCFGLPDRLKLTLWSVERKSGSARGQGPLAEKSGRTPPAPPSSPRRGRRNDVVSRRGPPLGLAARRWGPYHAQDVRCGTVSRPQGVPGTASRTGRGPGTASCTRRAPVTAFWAQIRIFRVPSPPRPPPLAGSLNILLHTLE